MKQRLRSQITICCLLLLAVAYVVSVSHAQEGPSSNDREVERARQQSLVLERLLRPEIMGIVLCIVAVVCWGVVATVKALLRHHERIEMLRQGIHPDAPESGEPGVPPKPAKG
jgi:drug/metabolite transporter (DMT)-like permease